MSGTVKNKIFSSRGEQDTTNIGTAGTGVSVVNWTESKDIVTVLTFTNLVLGVSATSANKAVGALIYTFPAGSHLHLATHMDVSLTHASEVTGDLGIGSVIGAGAVALLSGTPDFEDYITGQAASTAPAGGSAVKMMTAATAGPLTGISLNREGSVKAVHLNFAALWVAAPTTNLTATGVITLKWTKMS